MSKGKEIFQAIKDKNIQKLEQLLSHTDLHSYDPQSNEDTALHEAVKSGSEKIVKLLVEKKHKINALNKFNDTPLHLAALRPNVNIIKILINNGAKLDLKNNRDKSAKDLAVEANNKEIVEILSTFEGLSK